MQRKAHTTTGALKPPLEMPLTPTKALPNVCSCALVIEAWGGRSNGKDEEETDESEVNEKQRTMMDNADG